MTTPTDPRCEQIIAEMREHDGLVPVDIERFWAEDELAKRDPFSPDCPQVPCGVMMSGEAVWDELGIAEDWTRYEFDPVYRVELHRGYNDIAQRIVGRRLLSEAVADPSRQYPKVRMMPEIFEAEQKWNHGSWWMMQSAASEDELKALLDRVEERLEPGKLRDFMLPGEWDSEKQRLMGLGVRCPAYRFQRGPVTFATSIYGAENLLFLIMDNPELAGRMRDVILRAMLGIGQVLDVEAGWKAESAWGRGFQFNDDNCALLTPEMYEFFGYPILQAMFERYAPNAGDRRYQHSDSAMGHLLGLLGRLNMTGVNFGPKVMVREIRKHMPGTVIEGVLAPFTFSRDDRVGMVNEFLRDYDQARECRGLRFATAGSINNGSRLAGMRLLMGAIQKYGRY